MFSSLKSKGLDNILPFHTNIMGLDNIKHELLSPQFFFSNTNYKILGFFNFKNYSHTHIDNLVQCNVTYFWKVII